MRKEFERFGDVRDVYIPKDFYTRYHTHMTVLLLLLLLVVMLIY